MVAGEVRAMRASLPLCGSVRCPEPFRLSAGRRGGLERRGGMGGSRRRLSR